MAVVVACANGDWTDSTTWYLGDATSFADGTTTTNTNLTTSYVSSQNFTPGAITIDGICVKIANRAGSTGTMSVELYNATGAASVAGTEVTIDVADVLQGDIATSGGCGWHYFKFGSPVTLLAATAYNVRAKTSSATQIALYRTATAGDWFRVLVTTTNQAPAAADVMIISAAYTAAGARTDYTVTMNETATTDYGKTLVCQGGSLVLDTGASTNYNFKTSGILDIWGTVDFGAATLPTTSTFTLQFDNTGSLEYGYEVHTGGTFTGSGQPKTPHVMLGADASAGATSITLDTTPTGWLSGDNIVIGTTTRTRTECEVKALSADVSTTTASIAALTNAHGGDNSTGVQADLSNLTRNIKITGVSASATAWGKIHLGGTLNLSHVEFRYWGSNTAQKRGHDLQMTTGSVVLDSCPIWDSTISSSMAVYISGATSNNFEISNCAMYNHGSSAVNLSAATSGTNYIIDNNRAYLMGGTAYNLTDVGGVITNNKSSGAGGAAFSLSDVNPTGTVGNLVAYGGGGSIAINLSNYAGIWELDGISAWRNSNVGISVGNTSRVQNLSLRIINPIAFGNGSVNLNIATTLSGNIEIVNPTIDAGATLAATEGIRLSSTVQTVRVYGGGIGVNQTHSTGDVIAQANVVPFIKFYGTDFGSSNEIVTTNLAQAPFYPGIVSMNHGNVSGDNRRYCWNGIARRDTTTLSSVSLSERITPSSATVKIDSSSKYSVLDSGETVTVSVKVRKSVVGDGTAYNGNQPRLMVRANYDAGITEDTELDASTVSGDGAYETLSATTANVAEDCVLEFYVDCDGTTGWINIYDWATNRNNNPNNTNYWYDGTASFAAEYNAGGSGGGQVAYTFMG